MSHQSPAAEAQKAGVSASGPEVMNAPTWSGQHVTIDEVVKAVEDLRHSDKRAANRTSVATVVMVARDQEDMAQIENVLVRLRPRHPARVITLNIDHEAFDQDDDIDAGAVLLTGKAQDHNVWSDEIHLRLAGGPARHRASLLRPLVLADLPVVVWWVSSLPDAGDPLLKIADTVVVDSKAAISRDSDPRAAMLRVFDEIALLSRKNVVCDLAWVRIGMWRQMLASQFNGAVFRPFLQDIESVEISGKSSPVTLLTGWLASRLRLDRDVIKASEGRHLSIKLRCHNEGRTANVLVERKSDEHLIRASVEIENGPSHSELLAMPDDGVAGALLSVLKRLERDRVYEQSIRLVAGWYH